MKRSTLLWLAILLLPLIPLVRPAVRFIRGVVPYQEKQVVDAGPFDPEQSVALFVGISKFKDPSLSDVEFAADDAADLAFTFGLGANVGLVKPERIVVALSGTPRKRESKERLEKLRAAGAQIVSTTDHEDLYQHLEQQASLAGRDGLFIAFFATHGFNRDGVPHLLARSSLFHHPETAMSAAKIAEIVGQSDAARSLILIDACRERVDVSARAGSAEPTSAAPFIDAMNKVAGQVIFYAAAPGSYAYDDVKRQNGVFTAAVIDSLQCRPVKNQKFITVASLSNDVEKRVLSWLRAHRHPFIRKATQLSTEGATRTMPLQLCRATSLAILDKRSGPIANVTVSGATLKAFDAKGQLLWSRPAPGRIRKTTIGGLLGANQPHVIVISDDERGATASLLSVYDPQGKVIGTYHHDAPLQTAVIGRPTARHHGRIVVTATNTQLDRQLHVRGPVAIVLLLNVAKNKPLQEAWYGAIRNVPRIEQVEINDSDANGDHDIAITTPKGGTLHLDFEGGVLRRDRDTQFELIAK